MDVPAAPQGVLVPPEDVAAYISSDASRKIAVLDLKAWKIGKLIEVGAGADGLAGSRRIDSSHHH